MSKHFIVAARNIRQNAEVQISVLQKYLNQIRPLAAEAQKQEQALRELINSVGAAGRAAGVASELISEFQGKLGVRRRAAAARAAEVADLIRATRAEIKLYGGIISSTVEIVDDTIEANKAKEKAAKETAQHRSDVEFFGLPEGMSFGDFMQQIFAGSGHPDVVNVSRPIQKG